MTCVKDKRLGAPKMNSERMTDQCNLLNNRRL
jgi:hypothetical protein